MFNIIFLLFILIIGMINYYVLRDFWCSDVYQ